MGEQRRIGLGDLWYTGTILRGPNLHMLTSLVRLDKTVVFVYRQDGDVREHVLEMKFPRNLPIDRVIQVEGRFGTGNLFFQLVYFPNSGTGIIKIYPFYELKHLSQEASD